MSENILIYIKKYYRKNGKSPSVKEICNANQISSRSFYDHFPKGITEALSILKIPVDDKKIKSTKKANIARRVEKKNVETERNKPMAQVTQKKIYYVINQEKYVNRSENNDPLLNELIIRNKIKFAINMLKDSNERSLEIINKLINSDLENIENGIYTLEYIINYYNANGYSGKNLEEIKESMYDLAKIKNKKNIDTYLYQ